ncbi:MAG: aminoacyl-histidine dipeptidase [Edaphocola sp.]
MTNKEQLKQTMNLSNIEPRAIWHNFSKLNSVPRPSKKEERVTAFIKKFGEDLGLPTTVDAVGNVIIAKPATPGMEMRQAVVLQSHLDMVCQKNNDVAFDFDTQGIDMYVEGDWVRAKGTTLGADNGLGVATIMALLESQDIPHPALEALFTIDEETGMTGALNLQPGTLKANILLNLDTEEDDEITIGCAGGIDVTATAAYPLVPAAGTGINIAIKGLKGGHSGMDIHKGLGNANIILSRLLFALAEQLPLQLVSIDGGGLRNAIPREAHALLVVADADTANKISNTAKQQILDEFASLEPALNINILAANHEGKALSTADSDKIIHALKAAHNGVYRMSPDVAGLVEASNNVARVLLHEDNLQILNLSRSSVESSKDDVANQLKAVFELAGMEVEFSGAYPGWKPLPGSAIVQLMERIYKDNFGHEPKVTACHAGLECGIIGAHYPKMEMVSFGPTIRGAHSPEERASISSVQKFWGFLQDILAGIPE